MHSGTLQTPFLGRPTPSRAEEAKDVTQEGRDGEEVHDDGMDTSEDKPGYAVSLFGLGGGAAAAAIAPRDGQGSVVSGAGTLAGGR